MLYITAKRGNDRRAATAGEKNLPLGSTCKDGH
jgi:hypothetical protein